VDKRSDDSGERRRASIIITKENIVSLLPYTKPFLFVDSIEAVDENSVTGSYTYNEQEFFYKGHFKGYPVTPGVILTETMAQIGLVCLGIFLLKGASGDGKVPRFAMVSSDMEFLVPVYPGEKVSVVSEKIYFRFGKLKCKAAMTNSSGKTVCKGTISGIIIKNPDE
jgi:3-hydroxyacyl-[acyl-carrier-protein] dehydratase